MKNLGLQALGLVTLGCGLGYLAASGGLNLSDRASAAGTGGNTTAAPLDNSSTACIVNGAAPELHISPLPSRERGRG